MIAYKTQLEAQHSKLSSDFASMTQLTESQISDLAVENGRAIRNKELEVQPFFEEVQRIDQIFQQDVSDLRELYEPKILQFESELDILEKAIEQDQNELQSITQSLLGMKDSMKNTMLEFIQRVSEDEINYWQNEERSLQNTLAEEEDMMKRLTKKALETSAALSILNPKFEEQVGKASKTSKVLSSMMDSLQHHRNTTELELDSLYRISSEKSHFLQVIREEVTMLAAILAEASDSLSKTTALVAARLQNYGSAEFAKEYTGEEAFTQNRYSNKTIGLVNIFDRELIDLDRLNTRLRGVLTELEGSLHERTNNYEHLKRLVADRVTRRDDVS